LETPEPVSETDVLRVHTDASWEQILSGTFTPSEERILELPFSDDLRTASLLAAGGTLLAGRLALDEGIAVHLGGGFHHAFADHGEGLCLLNAITISAAALLTEGVVKRIAVVDLDVHHGNGTASIFADEPGVYTFSMHHHLHDPALKPPSDRDEGLEDGVGDEEYLRLLSQHLPNIMEEYRPQLVLYLAGADPYEADQFGGLALTQEGLRARDEMVLKWAREADVEVAITLAGGYAIRPADTVAIHCGTVEAALA